MSQLLNIQNGSVVELNHEDVIVPAYIVERTDEGITLLDECGRSWFVDLDGNVMQLAQEVDGFIQELELGLDITETKPDVFILLYGSVNLDELSKDPVVEVFDRQEWKLRHSTTSYAL